MIDFKHLYETYAADVHRFSLWLAGDGDEAEDITSETFLRAWSRRDDIRTETLKAYLFAIARNIFLKGRRKRRRQTALEDVHRDPAPRARPAARVANGAGTGPGGAPQPAGRGQGGLHHARGAWAAI